MSLNKSEWRQRRIEKRRAAMYQETIVMKSQPKRRGRPPGSKSKSIQASEALPIDGAWQYSLDEIPPVDHDIFALLKAKLESKQLVRIGEVPGFSASTCGAAAERQAFMNSVIATDIIIDIFNSDKEFDKDRVDELRKIKNDWKPRLAKQSASEKKYPYLKLKPGIFEAAEQEK